MFASQMQCWGRVQCLLGGCAMFGLDARLAQVQIHCVARSEVKCGRISHRGSDYSSQSAGGHAAFLTRCAEADFGRGVAGESLTS